MKEEQIKELVQEILIHLNNDWPFYSAGTQTTPQIEEVSKEIAERVYLIGKN